MQWQLELPALRKRCPKSPPKQLGHTGTLRCVLQCLWLKRKLWEALLERWLRRGDLPTCRQQAAEECCWNTLCPNTCSNSTHSCERPLNCKGLRVLVSAGPLPALRPTQDQVRPGERVTHTHTPQGQFTSRAKVTSSEGKGEPSGTVQSWALPTADPVSGLLLATTA